MRNGPDIAETAALLGDPARANMLLALLSGQALTATELASEGGVSKSTASSHLARLEAGDYRVESRFEPGNAVAEMTVAIKPGILSSLEISHLAGLVRVEFPRSGEESFEVRAIDGDWAWRGQGPGGDLVLAPGRYEARTLTGEERNVGFEVSQGDSIVVLLEP